MAQSRSPSGADAVRRSLDTHAIDGESEDRPYLVSMLRRLGYTDAQIADYLAGRAEPGAPAAAPPAAGGADASPLAGHAVVPPGSKPHARVEPDHGGSRDVEVEYTGPGLQDYRLVDPVDFFGDEGALVEFQSGDAALAEEVQAQPVDDGSELYRAGAEETAGVGEPGEELGSDGQPLAEFTASESPPSETVSDAATADTATETAETAETAWSEADAAAADAAEQAELAEIARRQGLTWDDTQAQAQDQTIHYGDYTLYHKDDVRDGHAARVYAFSKSPPGEGYEAATQLPEGYEVAENPETGRPFLRRLGEEDWGQATQALAGTAGPGSGDPSRRRVRLKRVRAANREEAMRLVEREGGSPLASVPIDIEKHLGDE